MVEASALWSSGESQAGLAVLHHTMWARVGLVGGERRGLND